MKTIYKFGMPDTGEKEILLPWDAIVRHVGVDPYGRPDLPTLWIELDTEETTNKVTRLFRFYGTGHPIENVRQTFHGSVVASQYVWHVYEVTS